MRTKSWLIAGFVLGTLFIMAACGGGPGGTSPDTGVTAEPIDNTAADQGSGGIGTPPHVFVGTVSIDGSPAPDGTMVTAYIEGNSAPVAESEVTGGSYTLMVEQAKDVSYAGKAVTFKLGELDAPEKAAWEFGGADEVNLSASSGSGSSGGTGDAGAADLASQGLDIFTGVGGCGACHTIDGVSTGMVGPDLTHIGSAAADRKPGFSAKDYITESVKDPEAFVATGVERANAGIMTNAITAGFSDEVVDALVAFLMEQE